MTTGDLPVPFEPARTEVVARYPPPPPRPDPEPLAEWRRYLLAARRYRWLVLGVTLLGTAAGVGLSLLLPPTYVARATVWIQVPSGRVRDVRDRGPIWQGQLPISSGWTDLLQTNVVLEDVVRRHRLYLTPRQPGDTDALLTFGIKSRVRPALYRLVVDSTGRTWGLPGFRRPARSRPAAWWSSRWSRRTRPRSCSRSASRRRRMRTGTSCGSSWA